MRVLAALALGMDCCRPTSLFTSPLDLGNSSSSSASTPCLAPPRRAADVAEKAGDEARTAGVVLAGAVNPCNGTIEDALASAASECLSALHSAARACCTPTHQSASGANGRRSSKRRKPGTCKWTQDTTLTPQIAAAGCLQLFGPNSPSPLDLLPAVSALRRTGGGAPPSDDRPDIARQANPGAALAGVTLAGAHKSTTPLRRGAACCAVH